MLKDVPHSATDLMSRRGLIRIMFCVDGQCTAPKEMGYDKVDFLVTWEDGETYEGRFDMKYEHKLEENMLGRQITDVLLFYAGENETRPHEGTGLS